MNFKEQLSKHENILNKYKDLYIDKKTNDENKVMNKDVIFNLNQDKNNNNLMYSNTNENNNTKTNFQINNSDSNITQSNMNLPTDNNDIENENLNLEQINNLLEKLNFKRENKDLLDEKPQTNENLSNTNITQEKKIINKTLEKKLDIENIKSKYQNNEFKSFNITQKYFNDSNENVEKSKINEENSSLQENNSNNYLNTINNIKKLKTLNARKEIERIKAKYYFPKNIYNTSKNSLIINTTNNFDTSFNQLSKEIAEIKEKLDSYQKEFKNKNYINNEQILPKNEANISIVNSNNIIFKKEDNQEKAVCNEICTNLNNGDTINDCDYSEVLPILDKVSKLKDLTDIDDNFDQNDNNQEKYDINDEDEVPGIVSNVLDALSNKLITSSLEEIKENKNEKKEDFNKPKLISKNNIINRENKAKKILSFEEFLSKEESNNNP